MKASERCLPRPVTLKMLSTQAPAITAAATRISVPLSSKPPQIGTR